MKYQLNISGLHHEQLYKHLYPGDGKEAVAIALCGRYCFNGLTKLMVHEVHPIPYSDCSIREEDIIHWHTTKIQPVFEKAYAKQLSILKIHSHPTGYKTFSAADDISDKELFASAFGWIGEKGVHASAVMLPDGDLFGRIFSVDLKSKPLNKILIAGDELKIFPKTIESEIDESGKRTAQAFGNKTYQLLKDLKVGVVGCSGTGSPVIEQLVRLGVKNLVIADPDKVELKNINRILHSTIKQAEKKAYKVDVLTYAINNIGIGTQVTKYTDNLYENNTLLKDLASCDFIFGCMDSVDGRHLLNQLATFYLVPYIDLGVKLEADGNGGVSVICGSVHYLQPGKSSLLSRGVYTIDDLKAAGQIRTNPNEYRKLLKNAYIKNINVDRPAVISVNMLISSLAVNEFLNRIHSYKAEAASCYAKNSIDLTKNYLVNESEENLPLDNFLLKRIGRGDMEPFLETPELSKQHEA